MNIAITDIKDTTIPGVQVYFNTETPYRESYFEWAESPLTVDFHSSRISGGVLTCLHHIYQFQEVEYHEDKEMFYFVSGTAIMLFADLAGGKPDPQTAQIVRIPAGTQIVIDAGKGHFIAIAEDQTPVQIVVVSPKMAAPRSSFAEPVMGI